MIEVPVRGSDRPALVDELDLALIARSWKLKRGYAVTRVYAGRRDGHSVKREVAMHRLLMGLEHGDVREVDHINRDRLDNQRTNLRIVTRHENAQNQGAHNRWGERASKHRGVHWDKRAGKWKVAHRLNGKLFASGYFHDETEASSVAAEWRALHMPFG